MAPAQDMGWHCCGSFLRYPVNRYSLGLELHLRDTREPALDCGDLLRSKACGARDRCCRRYPHREPGIEKRSDVDCDGCRFYCDIFLPRPISLNHH